MNLGAFQPDNKALIGLFILVLVGAVVFIGPFVASGFFGLSTPPVSKPTYSIGVVIPLSGSQAPYGEGIRQGLELAASEINASYPFSIQLVFEDNHGEVKETVSAVQRLISTEKPIALITGPSQHAVAVSPLAQTNQIVLYAMASQTKDLESAGEFVFRNEGESSLLGQKAAELAKDRGAKTAAVLYANYNETTVNQKDAFVSRFGELDGETTAVESTGKGETDFRTQLSKIKSTNPDVLFVAQLTNENIPTLQQVRELGVSSFLLVNGSIETQEVLDGAKDTAEGVVFVTFSGFPKDSYGYKIKAKFNENPKRWSPEAYDGLFIIANAVMNSNENPVTPVGLQKSLNETRSYCGESGCFSFDENGNAQKPVFIKQVKNGKFVSYLEN
ncbi:MAG: ABC transporter substrate-binding protein [Candidatus Diapherotrites archaeon]|uniref:ABC transporter substrate-binding protein n=1 Tax=Candidatus Iainarchaeum sp. TaxID=3101447 RepID=A0A8T4L3J6_9ARCH|nr:ABC transporter substrate-binding protein [Candidatus Diapherotrites archaeon]